MWRSYMIKLAISLPLLVVLILVDEIPSLQELPVLLIAVGIALLASEPLRVRLMSKGKAGLAMLPFMGASLVLMLVYCWRQDPAQAILLVITIALVFDVLLVALAAIGEVTKRGLVGLAEFCGLVVMGLALGGLVSLILVLPGHFGGTSLAGR